MEQPTLQAVGDEIQSIPQTPPAKSVEPTIPPTPKRKLEDNKTGGDKRLRSDWDDHMSIWYRTAKEKATTKVYFQSGGQRLSFPMEKVPKVIYRIGEYYKYSNNHNCDSKKFEQLHCILKALRKFNPKPAKGGAKADKPEPKVTIEAKPKVAKSTPEKKKEVKAMVDNPKGEDGWVRDYSSKVLSQEL
jgi:hypothetical protein